MTISNLYAKFAYMSDWINMPVLLWLHGWGGAASDYTDDSLKRMASWGFFVCAVGMRGRDNADGARDASGREIYDIYDALQYIRATYPNNVSTTLAAIVGYSGGGGNALAAACKFPDTFCAVVDFYGMSDYGRDGTDGWYQNCDNGTFETQISTAVGGVPASMPNNYYARDATAAITNYTGGHIVLFHDTEDGTVPYVHSTRIKNALDAAALTNYTTQFTTVGSSPRWTHAAGEEWDATGIAAKNIWVPIVKAQSVWTVPTSGTVTVIGYIVTKRFTVWLNQGLTAAATVAYNTATDTYTVTPLTGSLNVTITQGAKSGSATGITEATVITVT